MANFMLHIYVCMCVCVFHNKNILKNEKKADVSTLISEKVDFRAMRIIRGENKY